MSALDNFHSLCASNNFDPSAANTVAELPDYGDREVTFTKISEQRPGFVPVGYWTTGILDHPVKVNGMVYMERVRRAGLESEPDIVERLGFFNTSPIRSIVVVGPDLYILNTLNSQWFLDARVSEAKG